MKEINKKLKSTILILILAASAVLFSLMFYRRPTFNNQMNQMKVNVQAALDSTISNIHRDNSFYQTLEERITANDTLYAIPIVDSLIKSRPYTYELYYYKGLINERNGNLDSALYYFSYAMIRSKYTSPAIIKRANLLLKMNKVQDALADYREAYIMNYDHAFELGMAYDKINMKDSALFYYSIYKQHYPSDKKVIEAILSLNR
jgi:tetratricopeptide (TPR) repeat protein